MKFLFIFALILFLQNVKSEELSCLKWSDYFWFSSKENCFEASLNIGIPDQLKLLGLKYKDHEITTEDGYILTAFQIFPHEYFNKTIDVVALQHGLGQDGEIFLMGSSYKEYSNYSMTEWMTRYGYEVWIVNNRGTRYSRKHKTLSSNDFKYWDFSFHEIALYDIPAFLDYIIKTSGDKLKIKNKVKLLGYGMAGTANLAYTSLKPNDKVEVMVNVAPVAIMKNVKSPLRFLAPFYKIAKIITDVLRIGSILNPTSLSTVFIKSLVHLRFTKKLVAYVLAFFVGWTPNEMDPVLVNVALGNIINPVPVKQLYHYAQMYNAGKFQQFDYGKKKNMEIYNSEKPTEYPLENITTIVRLYSSPEDSISPWEDTKLIYGKLSEITQQDSYFSHFINFNYTGANHLDYIYGIRRFKDLYLNIRMYLYIKSTA